MGTVSFSGKAGVKSKTTPEPKQEQSQEQKPKIDYSKLVGDQSWYQSYCNKCPYLIMADALDMFICGCPAGEECLAKGILVADVILLNRYNDLQRQMQEKNIAFPPMKHKRVKTRRGFIGGE